VGTVQATVTEQSADQAGLLAEVAWVVAAPHQGYGYARDAAGAMVAWLREQGVATVVAHVHPDHRASQGVASASLSRASPFAASRISPAVIDGLGDWGNGGLGVCGFRILPVPQSPTSPGRSPHAFASDSPRASAWKCAVKGSISSSRFPSSTSGRRWVVKPIRWSVIRDCGKL